MTDHAHTLAAKTVRMLGTDPYGAEDTYYYLIREYDEDEHEACRLLCRTILEDMGEHWPDKTIDRLAGFAYQCCADKGIDPAETIADVVTFAVDMHDWNQITEE